MKRLLFLALFCFIWAGCARSLRRELIITNVVIDPEAVECDNGYQFHLNLTIRTRWGRPVKVMKLDLDRYAQDLTLVCDGLMWVFDRPPPRPLGSFVHLDHSSTVKITAVPSVVPVYGESASRRLTLVNNQLSATAPQFPSEPCVVRGFGTVQEHLGGIPIVVRAIGEVSLMRLERTAPPPR